MEALHEKLPQPQRNPSLPSGVSVRELPGGSTLVRISGRLPIGWLGSLALGITDAGFNVARGRARRTERQRWEIELELAPSRPGQKGVAVDYLLLASRRRRVDGPLPIVVERYSLERDPERRVLVVELRGVDRVGFLGSLLDRLSGLLLFPVEMEIETEGASVVDRFTLQTLGGEAPSPLAERSLAALLDRLC